MKLKILVCAYSCLKDPDERFGDGGEGVLGWNMVKQLSRFYDVWVLTHYKNREVIESKIKEYLPKSIHFYYIKLPLGLESLNKFHGGIQFAAYLWQVKAYFFAKRLNNINDFKAFHHITYANDWMASYIGALLPIPYIRGPGGGAHKIPKAFLTDYSFKDKLIEKLRSVGQWVFRHDPFFIIGQKKARAILICNNESFLALPEKLKERAVFFPVNGISKEDFLNDNAGKKASHKFIVLSAGKLLKLKNFNLAIKAFSLFNKNYPNSILEIIGQGPEEENLKKIAKELKIEKSVLFLGWHKRENLLKKIKEGDVFLFASLRDGGGAVVIEAMAQGKPVICFDIAGPGFHIKKEWGIKIKTEDQNNSVKDIAGALESLYKDKALRNELGKKARERAENYYLWDILGNKLNQIYQDKIIKD